MKTSTGLAPWKIVEGYDARYRSISVATAIRDAIRFRLEEARTQATAAATVHLPSRFRRSRACRR